MKSFLNKNNNFIKYTLCSLVLCLTSCEDFVEINPPITSLTDDSIFIDDEDATLAVNGIYARIVASDHFITGNNGGSNSVSVLLGMYSDEFVTSLFSLGVHKKQYDSYLVNSENLGNARQWSTLYNTIHQANTIVERLLATDGGGVSNATKSQLEGEAKFIRAMCYFYLVNTWGDVPLTTTANFSVNATLSRTSTTEVYNQIIADLTEAENLLTDNYVTPGRLRPNKFVATSLLARVYLYIENWAEAEAHASAVINNALYNLASNIDDVFNIDSEEAIWQLPIEVEGFNTFEGSAWYTIIFDDINLSPDLLSSFEPGDLRRTNWVGSTLFGGMIPGKYRQLSGTNTHTQDFTPFRLAEQYLIRAEARAQLNTNLTGVQDDLNLIRNRAGLANTTATDQSSLLVAIAQERYVELFSELGHRWYDLKRTGKADAELSFLPNWDSDKLLLPLPQTDLDANPNLKPQNPGY